MTATIALTADRGTGEPVSLGAALLAGKKVRPDVTLLLEQDHREAMGYFDWYAAGADSEARLAAAQKLCAALRAHMAAEEEIFYPALRTETGKTSMVEHAIEEHAEAKEMIDRIEQAIERNELPDADMESLRGAIEEHVAEEESEVFQEARSSELDLYDLGRRVASRKVEFLFGVIAGKEAAHPQESEKMAISKDEAHALFLAGLRDIHAAVRQGKEMVERQIERVRNYPHVEERLQAHLKDKDAQLERVEGILESFGEERSRFKDFTMAAAGNLAAMTTATTEDEVLKNSLATFGLANFEAASYESLLVLGTAAGHHEAVRTLQSCLSEERAMAAWLAENLRGLIHMHLQYRTEGLQASR